jgi:hypothetical protein
LADPVVSLALFAETRGLLSLKGYHKGGRDSLAILWRLHEAKNVMDFEIAGFDTLRIFSEMNIKDIDVEDARGKALEAYKKLRSIRKPWLKSGEVVGANSILDLKAMWYIINAPEKLREYGIDYGTP